MPQLSTDNYYLSIISQFAHNWYRLIVNLRNQYELITERR